VVPTKEELNKGFKLGEWEVLPAKGILRRGDREEKPEPMVLKVLLALASRDGDLVTRDELIDDIWDGRPIGDEPINRCVALLRAHLGDKERPHQYIETLTRRGYRLNLEVRLNEPASPGAEQRQLAEKVSNQGRLWMVVAAIVVTILIAIFISAGPPVVRSIAVLPFENLSADPADQYLVSGFKIELVRTLHNVPDVTVKNGRDAYPGLEVSDIAEILDVDAVLFGEMLRVGDTLEVSYHVDHGIDGEIISSGEIKGQIEDFFAMQEKLAVMVRDDLFGESPQQLISARRNPNSAAFEPYMRGLVLFEHRGRGRPENLDIAIELFEQSIQLDPGFGPAYLSLATAYALLPDYRGAPLVETHERAIEVVERGIQADSSISDAAGAVYGFVYHKQKKWVQAEEAYIRATTARVVDSNAFNWYSLMLAGVGRLDDALEQILEAQKIDPSSPVINVRVAVIYTYLGESEKASDFYQRSKQLGASIETYLISEVMVLIREGRAEEAVSLVGAGVSALGGATAWIGPVYEAIQDPSMRGAAKEAIDAAFQDGQINPRLGMVARVILQDVEGAMEVALSLADPDDFSEMDFLFMPELRPLRQHADFPVLMDKLGVQDYWDENGCVWLDDSVDCPD